MVQRLTLQTPVHYTAQMHAIKHRNIMRRREMAISSERVVEDLIGTLRESLKAHGFEIYPFKVIYPAPRT